MNNKQSIAITFILIVYSMQIWAKPGYAELLTDGTLWFFSGDKPNQENCYDVDNTNGYPAWDCSKIKKVVFGSSFSSVNPKSTKRWFYNAINLKEIVGWKNLDTIGVKDMESMFEGCCSLESIDLSNFYSYNTTNMASMFKGCSKLKSIDLSGLNVSSVTNMVSMFEGCTSLESIDLSNFNSINVKYMTSMFFRCTNLSYIKIAGLQTQNVEYMNLMFGGCNSLKTIDLSSLNTKKLKSTQAMFIDCSSLESVVFGDFTTNQVNDMSCMFYGCQKLEIIDLSNFETTNLYQMWEMFHSCTSLKTIYVSNLWDTSNFTGAGQNMFNACWNLSGGKGTKYNSINTDYTYAHIDEGISNPGYFTDKNTESAIKPIQIQPRLNQSYTQNNQNVIKITGAPEGSIISVYNLSGKLVGSSQATFYTTYILTTLRSGELGIIKIGDTSMKILMK